MYEVIDRQTGKRVGTYKTLRAACRAVDRLDLQYGGCRYFHRRLSASES